jgi:hypothetical protein
MHKDYFLLQILIFNLIIKSYDLILKLEFIKFVYFIFIRKKGNELKEI